MNKIEKFISEEFGNVRAAYQNGQAWFVAKDVCKALEIKNVSDAVERLDDDEKGIVLNYTHGGEQKMLAVNEFGLYSLVLTSRKPSARKFKRWITHEVLPRLRRQALWEEIRQGGKGTRRNLTDVIKEFCDYLQKRGELDRPLSTWIIIFTKLANKAAGISDKRDNLQYLQLLRLQDAEDLLAEEILRGIEDGKSHHDIWLACQEKLKK